MSQFGIVAGCIPKNIYYSNKVNHFDKRKAFYAGAARSPNHKSGTKMKYYDMQLCSQIVETNLNIFICMSQATISRSLHFHSSFFFGKCVRQSKLFYIHMCKTPNDPSEPATPEHISEQECGGIEMKYLCIWISVPECMNEQVLREFSEIRANIVIEKLRLCRKHSFAQRITRRESFSFNWVALC